MLLVWYFSKARQTNNNVQRQVQVRCIQRKVLSLVEENDHLFFQFLVLCSFFLVAVKGSLFLDVFSILTSE